MKMAKLFGVLLGLIALAATGGVAEAGVRQTVIAPTYSASFYPVAKTVGHVVGTPLITLPQSAALAFVFNPDDLNGSLADGASILSLTDSLGTVSNGSITGTSTSSTTAPTLAKNSANGHSAYRFSGPTKWINLGHPSILSTTMSDARYFSVMVVFKNATSTSGRVGGLFGDTLTTFRLGANVLGSTNSTALSKSYSPGDPNTGVHTLIYSGDASARVTDLTGAGRLFLDGTQYSNAFSPLAISTDNTQPFWIGNVCLNAGCSSATSPNTTNGGFVGDILYIVGWNTRTSAAEAWQADSSARWTFGKPLATAGLSYMVELDGDSQTMGVGATPDTSLPALVASSLGLKLGQYVMTGKSGATVSSGSNSGNNLIDSAARDVDQFRAVTGLPIVVVVGEYYNQGTSGGTTTTGDTLAATNRLYSQLRKATDPTVKVIMWTSLGNWNRVGTARNQFNLDLFNLPGQYIDAVIPVHLDPTIGCDACLGTTGSGNTVSNDGVHLNLTGVPYHAGAVVPFVHRYPITAINPRDLWKAAPANDNQPEQLTA